MKAVFFNIPASGHVNPSLALVAELVRRGETIIYYGTENFRAKIEATGATFRPYAQLTDTYFEDNDLDGSNPTLTSRRMMEQTRRTLPELIAATRAESPDYLLYDSMCPWGVLVARVLGVPSVTSLALLLFSPAMLIRSSGMVKVASMMLKNLPNLRAFMQTSNAIAREHNIPPLSFTEFFFAPADLTISYTMPPIQPEAETLGKGVAFVGPSIAPRPDNSGFPFEQLKGKQVIYVSLGTVINNNPAFFQACIQAFAGTPYTIIMSIGESVSFASLGTIPPNFIVRPFNPQLEILQRTTLFITHAGMNSVHEGLYYDVPLLLVPQTQEQNFVAQSVQALGAGIVLKDQSAGALRHSAERILNDPSYHAKAAGLGKILRAGGGAPRAAELVLAMVQEKKRSQAELILRG